MDANQKIEVNCKCPCGEYLCVGKDPVGLLPCQHLLHASCTKLISNRRCPICQNYINLILTFHELKKQISVNNYSNYQMYIDILSVSNCSHLLSTSYSKILIRTPFLMECLGRLALANNLEEIETLVNFFIKTCKIQIKVVGRENILDDKKVIIANHNGYFDPVIIYKVFGCGFLASEIVYDFWYIKNAIDSLPLLIIKRGTDKNTVHKMSEYVDQVNDIAIFPEGVITHPNTVARFRTGAFHTGHPIQPVIASYEPHVYDNSPTQFLLKLASQDSITATIKILPPEFPPFSPDKIENIRRKMAEAGNLAMSRVSNRSIRD